MADDYSMSDFVTPGQVEAQRAMAKALLAQSLHTPVGKEHEAVSPFAIGTQMTQALMGRMMTDQAGQQERASLLGDIRTEPEAPGTMGPPGRRAVSDATDPSGKALASLESGGDYNALGPIIKHGSMAGDRAYGKYQIMGSNIPKWTQEFLGHQMTPGEFLRNPEAQEAVRKGQFAKYVQQFGPEGAARAWLGGPGGVNHPERADQLGTTIGQYGQNFMARLASNAPVTPDTGPGGGAASAYAAEPAAVAPGPPDAPAAISKALAGDETKVAGGPKAAPGGVSAPAETGPSGEMRIPPGFVKGRPTMTRQQFERAMAGAVARGDVATQAYLRETYMNQHAPIQAVGPGGVPITINPDTGEQYAYPGAPIFTKEKSKTKTGPLEDERETEVPRYVVPPGYKGPIPGVTGADETAPAAPAPTTPAPTAPVVKPLDLSKPEEVPGKKSEAEGGVKLASLETGTMTDAGGGPLAVKPPEGATAALSPDAKVIPTEVPPGPTAAPTKVAEAGGLRGMSIPERLETALGYETEKERRTEEAKLGTKQLSEYGDSAKRILESSNRLKQQINDSREFIKSGLPIFGPFSEIRKEWHKILAAGGNKDSLNRLSATEAFDKNVASKVLSDMKTSLEKMGQIRIAEIDLLKRAMASTSNTPQSNEAILFVLDKVSDQMRTIANLTEQYQQGVRWDAGGKPMVDKDGNAVLSKTPPNASELRSTIAGYVDRHPLHGDPETAAKLDILDPGGTTRTNLSKEKAAEAEKTKKAEPKAEPKAELPASEEEIKAELARRKAAKPAPMPGGP